jgi:hypothetical protein
MEVNLKYSNDCSYCKRFYVKRFTANESEKPYQAIDYSVMKQSTVLSYMDIFMYLGIYVSVFQLYSSSKEEK